MCDEDYPARREPSTRHWSGGCLLYFGRVSLPLRILSGRCPTGLRDLVKFSARGGQTSCIRLEKAGTTTVRRHRSMLRPGGAASTEHPGEGDRSCVVS